MRILSLILAVAALASSAARVRGDESIPPDVLAAIKKATVFVKVQVEGQRYSGSGFVVKVDDGAVYVVTNHHVIEPKLIEIVAQWRSGPRVPVVPHGPHGRFGPRLPPGPAAPSLTPRLVVRTLKDADVTVVFRSGTPQEQAVHAEVLAADPEVDLAILKAVGVKNLPSPVDCSRDIELSETMAVFSFGFPFGEVLATSKGSPAITIGKASISSLRLDDAGQLALVQIDGALNPGNSGGPVVDTQGRLVGVAVATIKNSTGIGLAIPCKKVPEMLVGHLGKPHLHLSQDAQGAAIEVEASLIDPFHKIKSAALCYLSADKVQEKPQPSDRLKALPGCHQLVLKLQDNVALGQFPLKKGFSRVRILYQGVSVDENGRQKLTACVEETIEQPAEAAAKMAVDNPPEPAAEGSKNDTHPPKSSPPKRSGKTAKSNVNKSSKAAGEYAALVDDLNSGDAGRRIGANMQLLRVMPREPNRAVAKALERVLLEDGGSPIRCGAASALVNWGTPESIPVLQEAARKDPDSIVRSLATKAIEAIQRREGTLPATNDTRPSPRSTKAREEDLPSLVESLNSGDFSRRIRATMQLLREKPREPNREVAKALERVLLDDGDAAIRGNAVRCLETWGTPESIPALQQAAQKDPSSLVRFHATKTIEAIKLRQ